jgi:cytochrome c peroxidase
LKFKVPSLRNIAVSFPYMHDGRYYSIGQALDHYRTKIVTEQPTLDTLLKNRITISGTEKNALIYFLFTLTDTTLTKNPRFSLR